MQKKTKQSNEKMIMRKAGASAVGYTNPEKLSKQILTNVRAKKD